MRKLILVFSIFTGFTAFSQDNPISHETHKKDIVGLFAGNTVIYQSNIHLPTLGVEYVRELSHHWGVGLIVESEIGYHILEDKDTPDETSIYHRESAVLVSPAVFFRPFCGLILTVGYGV